MEQSEEITSLKEEIQFLNKKEKILTECHNREIALIKEMYEKKLKILEDKKIWTDVYYAPGCHPTEIRKRLEKENTELKEAVKAYKSKYEKAEEKISMLLLEIEQLKNENR